MTVALVSSHSYPFHRHMNNPLDIKRLDIHTLDVPLKAPFTTSSTKLEVIHNLAIQITLADGSIGWGEIPILPPITLEDQSTALVALQSEAGLLTGRNAGEWRRIAAELSERIPHLASVRAGIEMATIDALARSWHAPLFRFFGGYHDSVVTDITIPICSGEEAQPLAEQYRKWGFDTIKAKIGLDASEDVERLRAIRRGHPTCRLVLDANAGYSVEQTLDVLRHLRQAGIEPVLLEQPVAREDWEGLGRLARAGGVPVAADESCRTPVEAMRIAKHHLAQVINIKLAKCGVVQAFEIAAIARASHLGLMIGGMVETRLAMGFSAHFAAGLGGFDWIDLDTPLLLADDPISGGYRTEGARYLLDVGTAGHGGILKTQKVAT
jgi:L-alanine-DL-glutamate epimerase-like enolase superfamily enzyme